MKNEKQYFIDRHQGGERAILVQIDLFRQTQVDALAEFEALVLSANLDILTVIGGKRVLPSPKYFVGKGKAEEIAAQVGLLDAQVVIFNHELSAAQGRNLELLFHCRVIDRTELILDIFAQRARTFEGKLQVELAQLQHLRTQLIRGWTHLERQKGGIGLRGPGETQLETDRRLVDVRLKNIRKRLAKVESQREQGRRARKRASTLTVSLIGYTNAGKSTLFNYLTDAKVFTADQLFATLDPTLRQLRLPHIGEVVLADTVGFIRDLPHDLVAAFRATLEETRQADLLLHVVDASDPNYKRMIDNVEDVLAQIGASNVPQLRVFNKIDRCSDQKARIDSFDDKQPKRVWMSAATGDGCDLLKEAMVLRLGEQIIECEVKLAPDSGKLRAKLYQLGVVQSEEVAVDGELTLQLRIQQRDYQHLFH